MLSLPQLAAKARPSVFLLEVCDESRKTVATGSGFLISDGGLLITNRHVIERASSVQAKAENGGRYEVEGIVAYAADFDAVVLRIGGNALPFLSLTNSGATQVGDSVAVIGSPLGLEGSLSAGIVAAIRPERSGDGRASEMLPGFIQITAPISPGSSGSPVLNMLGEVIGVATFTAKEGGQNLNFAIPAAKVTTLLSRVTVQQAKVMAFGEFNQKLITSDRLMIHTAAEYVSYKAARERGDGLAQLEVAKVLVGRFPENSSAHFYFGNSLSDLQFFDEAIAAYRKSLEIAPEDAATWICLSAAFLAQGNVAEAKAAVRKAVVLMPENAGPWAALGLVLDTERNWTEAEAALRKAIAIDPNDGRVWRRLGRALTGQGKAEEAITAYRQAIIAKPDDVKAWNGLGGILASQHKLSEAADAFRKASAISPEGPEAWYSLGAVLAEQGRLEEALAACRKAVALKADDAKALTCLGKVFEAQKKMDEAITAYQQVAALQPKSAESWMDLAYALLKQKNYGDALAAFDRAAELGDELAIKHAQTLRGR